MYSVGHFKYRNSGFINDTALSKLPIMDKKMLFPWRGPYFLLTIQDSVCYQEVSLKKF